jgi:4'-phosphopantetheinyl transferase
MRRVASPPDLAIVYQARGRADEVPPGTEWLTSGEKLVEAGLAIAKRRLDWRLGRWLAKQAVSACLVDRPEEIQPSDVEVAARLDGAPGARVLPVGDAIPLSISISHSDGVGLAVAAAGDVALGCDVERIAPRSERFVADYLTMQERETVDRTPAHLRSTVVTFIWSAKEAALKVLKQGLRMDTRSVGVEVPSTLQNGTTHPRDGRWCSIRVHTPGARALEGYWWVGDGCVWTILGNRPVRLATD